MFVLVSIKDHTLPSFEPANQKIFGPLFKNPILVNKLYLVKTILTGKLI
jgi:hypothetical protein